MNEDLLAKMIVSGVSIFIIVSVVNLIRYIKYNRSEEGKLHKRIDKKKTALTQISKYESQNGFVNNDLIHEKKKEISKEIQNDILQYQLNLNKEYIELVKLKKQGILDEQSFNQAINKIKTHLKEKPNEKIKIVELDNGEKLKVEQYYKGTLKNSKLLSHLDKFNNQLIISGESYLEISNNKIKNIYQQRSYENGLSFAQENSTINIGDIILTPKKEFDFELMNVLSFCSVRIKGNKVTQVYWIKKGKTLNKKEVEIYQTNKFKRTYNDLVFINSAKPKDGYHLVNISGTLTTFRTKNGKIN